jgi:hypothetical protein
MLTLCLVSQTLRKPLYFIVCVFLLGQCPNIVTDCGEASSCMICQIKLILVRLLRRIYFKAPISRLPVDGYKNVLKISRRLLMYFSKAHRLCYILQTSQNHAWTQLCFKRFSRTRQIS